MRPHGIAHLQPTAPVAAHAICPGDPKRAMQAATALLERPRMSNLARGLWGYHGSTAAGAELTVQSTGIGGPSTAVVLAELAGLGVRRAIRLGTCRSHPGGPEPGSAVVVEAALALDGTSRALGARVRLATDPSLRSALAASLRLDPLAVASRDLPAELDAAGSGSPPPAPVSDLSTAAFLAAALRHGIIAAALLVTVADDERALDAETIDRLSGELAPAALAALSD